MTTDSSLARIDGEKVEKVDCSKVDIWLKSPEACQNDKDQVVVKEVINLSNPSPRASFNRLKKAGYHICFGDIEFFDRNRKLVNGFDVWLNGAIGGIGGIGGCWKGTGYRNANSGAEGPNEVTPLIFNDVDNKDRDELGDICTPTRKLVLFTDKSSTIPVGHKLDRWAAIRECTRKGENDFVLCTGSYDDKCVVKVSNDTLKIKLNLQ